MRESEKCKKTRFARSRIRTNVCRVVLGSDWATHFGTQQPFPHTTPPPGEKVVILWKHILLNICFCPCWRLTRINVMMRRRSPCIKTKCASSLISLPLARNARCESLLAIHAKRVSLIDEEYRSTVFGGLEGENGKHLKQNTTQELIPPRHKASFPVTGFRFSQKCWMTHCSHAFRFNLYACTSPDLWTRFELDSWYLNVFLEYPSPRHINIDSLL